MRLLHVLFTAACLIAFVAGFVLSIHAGIALIVAILKILTLWR